MGLPDTLEGQIGYLFNKIEELERRHHNTNRKGKVAQADYEKGLYRVELLADNGKGEPYLTPWIKIKETSAGANRTHYPKSVGAQVAVHSENGDLTDAEISHSLASKDHPPPSDKGDLFMPINVGKAQVFAEDGGDSLVLKVGSSSIKMTDGKIVFTAQDIEMDVS